MPQQQQHQQGAGQQQQDMVTNTQLLAHMQRMERQFKEDLQGVRTEQASFKPWARDEFKKVLRNQQKYGGTITQAFTRQNPGRQARIRNDNATAAAQERQQTLQQPQRQQQGNQNAQQQQRQQQQLTQAPPPRATNQRVRLGISPHAKLQNNLRSLHELWEEYVFGIGDNKPAKEWTNDERNGQGKPTANKYCRRMKVWRIQSYLTRIGYTIEAANDKIVDVYATDKVTSIIVCITNEQKNPNLSFIGGQRFNPRLIVNQQ